MRNNTSMRLFCLSITVVFCLITISKAEERKAEISFKEKLISEIGNVVDHNRKRIRRLIDQYGKLAQSLASYRSSTTYRFSADSLRDIERIRESNLKISRLEKSIEDIRFSVLENRQETEREIDKARQDAFYGMHYVLRMTAVGLAVCASLFVTGWIIIYIGQLRTNTRLAAVDNIIAKVCSLNQKIDLMPELFYSKRSFPNKKNAVCAGHTIDHSLACIVCSEIFRVRRKMNNGSDSSEIIKRALNRLEEDLISRGYTIRDMTGLRYNDCMAVRVVNFFVSDHVRPGEEKVERMIKPEISFRGEVIEPGKVEVSVSQVKQTTKPAV